MSHFKNQGSEIPRQILITLTTYQYSLECGFMGA